LSYRRPLVRNPTAGVASTDAAPAAATGPSVVPAPSAAPVHPIGAAPVMITPAQTVVPVAVTVIEPPAPSQPALPMQVTLDTPMEVLPSDPVVATSSMGLGTGTLDSALAAPSVALPAPMEAAGAPLIPVPSTESAPAALPVPVASPTALPSGMHSYRCMHELYTF